MGLNRIAIIGRGVAGLAAGLRLLRQEAPSLFADFEIYQAEDGSEAGRVGFHKV